MENKDNQENINKTPSKMARLAWPKAKYGAIIANYNYRYKFNLL